MLVQTASDRNFFDIDMPEVTGMELLLLEEQNCRQLLFLSAIREEAVFEAIHYKPFCHWKRYLQAELLVLP